MKTTSYAEYLSLPQLFDASSFADNDKSQLNFVIAHQITELWLKLLNNYLTEFSQQQTLSSLLAGESVIRQVNNIWEVFEHIPPKDFLSIRESLNGISGAESSQYAETIKLIKSNMNKCSNVEAIQTLSRIDSALQKWKLSHINLTAKLIGDRPGTGGSDGASYLKDKGTSPLISHEDLNQF